MATAPAFNKMKPHGTHFGAGGFNGALYEQNGWHYDGAGKPLFSQKSLDEQAAAASPTTETVEIAKAGKGDVNLQKVDPLEVYRALRAQGIKVGDDGKVIEDEEAFANILELDRKNRFKEPRYQMPGAPANPNLTPSPDRVVRQGPDDPEPVVVNPLDVEEDETGHVPRDETQTEEERKAAVAKANPYEGVDPTLAMKAWLTDDLPKAEDGSDLRPPRLAELNQWAMAIWSQKFTRYKDLVDHAVEQNFVAAEDVKVQYAGRE